MPDGGGVAAVARGSAHPDRGVWVLGTVFDAECSADELDDRDATGGISRIRTCEDAQGTTLLLGERGAGPVANGLVALLFGRADEDLALDEVPQDR